MEKKSIKKISRLVLGWLLLFLGVVGLFLPFLQGLLFITIGLAILASHYPWARLYLRKLKKKISRKRFKDK